MNSVAGIYKNWYVRPDANVAHGALAHRARACNAAQTHEAHEALKVPNRALLDAS